MSHFLYNILIELAIFIPIFVMMDFNNMVLEKLGIDMLTFKLSIAQKSLIQWHRIDVVDSKEFYKKFNIRMKFEKNSVNDLSF